jgi:hypothetical protein
MGDGASEYLYGKLVHGRYGVLKGIGRKAAHVPGLAWTGGLEQTAVTSAAVNVQAQDTSPHIG